MHVVVTVHSIIKVRNIPPLATWQPTMDERWTISRWATSIPHLSPYSHAMQGPCHLWQGGNEWWTMSRWARWLPSCSLFFWHNKHRTMNEPHGQKQTNDEVDEQRWWVEMMWHIVQMVMTLGIVTTCIVSTKISSPLRLPAPACIACHITGQPFTMLSHRPHATLTLATSTHHSKLISPHHSCLSHGIKLQCGNRWQPLVIVVGPTSTVSPCHQWLSFPTCRLAGRLLFLECSW